MIRGKALENFSEWIYKEKKISLIDLQKIDFEDLILLKYLITEWFDSVGIYIDRDMAEKVYKIWTKKNWETEPIIVDCQYLEKLSQWQPEAIKKAVEIYNSL